MLAAFLWNLLYLSSLLTLDVNLVEVKRLVLSRHYITKQGSESEQYCDMSQVKENNFVWSECHGLIYKYLEFQFTAKI
jgi:hypothetical protein